jgi:nitronate monooxygenase
MDTQFDTRLLNLFGIQLPIIQAPMAGATTPEMVIAVSEAGGLGSLPSGLYTASQLRQALDAVRAGTSRPINLNFFSHTEPPDDSARQAPWRRLLAPYYAEAGLDPDIPIAISGRAPFDDTFCAIVEEYRPEVVSFHFGLPPIPLFERVRRSGAKVISSATTVAEARWLEEHGVDAP